MRGVSPGASGSRSSSTMISVPSRSTTGRCLAKYNGTTGIFSALMYSHTSSSVQLDSGNTRMDSPGLDAGIEQPPQLGPLIARVPAVAGRAVREDALLGAAFFLVAPRAAEGRVEVPFVQRLAQAFRLHDLGVHRRAGGHRRDAAREPLFIDMHEQVHAEPRRGLVAKRDHLAEFPGRVDMQQRKRRLARTQRPFARRAASRSNPCRSNRASPDCGIR